MQLVLSRFGAARLIAQCAAKEMKHGHRQETSPEVIRLAVMMSIWFPAYTAEC
jgi:hypothetical protein